MPSNTRDPVSLAEIPLCAPVLSGNEWAYLKECIETGWVSSVGPFVRRFEQMVASYLGVRYAVATSSGTAALHIALLTAGIGVGDEVLVPTLTFIAPANAVRYVGAFPILMDADPTYWQLDPGKVDDFLTRECFSRGGTLYNKVSRRPVRAILPVHVLGHPADMESILAIAHRFGLHVIEDATESLGSKYKDRFTGSFGTVNCLSFNGNKIITTGGGGMIVTDDSHIAEKARYLTTQAKDDPLEYIHNELGYNYRLTNIQAALGVGQMEALSAHIQAKRRIRDTYHQRLCDVAGIELLPEAPWALSNCWLYTILVNNATYGEDSRSLIQRLKAQRIESRPFWRPVHQQLPYKDCQAYCVDIADRLYRDGVSLPCSVNIFADQIDRVSEHLISRHVVKQ